MKFYSPKCEITCEIGRFVSLDTSRLMNKSKVGPAVLSTLTASICLIFTNEIPFAINTLSLTFKPATSAGPPSVILEIKIPVSPFLYGVDPKPPAIDRPSPDFVRSMCISYRSSCISKTGSESPKITKY